MCWMKRNNGLYAVTSEDEMEPLNWEDRQLKIALERRWRGQIHEVKLGVIDSMWICCILRPD
jgi:hypothetical protein